MMKVYMIKRILMYTIKILLSVHLNEKVSGKYKYKKSVTIAKVLIPYLIFFFSDYIPTSLLSKYGKWSRSVFSTVL